MTTVVTAHDVVAFLLTQSRGHLSISAIHKLCYYAQGWHLAWQGSPLFSEDIQARNTGPVIPALYPFHKGEVIAEAWPAGNAAAITGETALVVSSVFDSYGHQSGLIMGNNAKLAAPWLRANAKATDEDPHPLIDHADMKAFFKAWNDAPQSATDYANRFLSNYA